jgi:hypothetical protein
VRLREPPPATNGEDAIEKQPWSRAKAERGEPRRALGAAATLLGLLTLWVLKWVEDELRRERTVRIDVEVDAEGPAETEIHGRLRDSGLVIWQSHCVVDIINGYREFRRRSDNMTPGVINNLERRQGVVRVEWRGGS